MVRKVRRGNGEGSVVKVGKTWKAIITIGWKDATHPIRHTKNGFKTAQSARQYIYAYKRGEVIKRSSKTLRYYWELYESSAMRSLSSSKQTHFRTVWHRIEELGDIEVAMLDVRSVQEIVNRYSYYPARDIKTLLSHIYKLAIADNEVEKNLSSSISLPELHEEETVPFTADEVERMWADYETHPEVGIALLMCYTGLMPGEVSKIKRDHIDFDSQTITGVGVKTDRRRSAAVVVPDRIMPVLRSLLEHGKNGGIMPYKMDTYRERFKEMVKRIGADSRCTPYSCRHTFATLMSSEVTAPVLARLMRNNIEVTDRYYLHHDSDTLLQEVNDALG